MAYFNNGNSNNYGNGRSDGRVEFRIFERLGILDRKDNGWTKEVNVVSWNGKPSKIDIREWDPDHLHMSRGITLWEKEAILLAKALIRRYTLEVPGDNEMLTQDFIDPQGDMAMSYDNEPFDNFVPDQRDEMGREESMESDGEEVQEHNREEYNVPDAGPLYGEDTEVA